jgi:hypothetical protein
MPIAGEGVGVKNRDTNPILLSQTKYTKFP